MGPTILYKLSKGINVNKVYRQIEGLIEQHDEITVIFADAYEEDKYNLRMRILTKDGDSYVSYKGHGYHEYSKPHRSCFLGGNFSVLKDYKKTLELMKEHDGKRIVPVAIWHGPLNVNKIVLGKQWGYVNEVSFVQNVWHSLIRIWLNYVR